MKIGIVYNLVETEERGFDHDLIADNEVEFNVKHIRNALKYIHEVIPIRIHRKDINTLNLKKLDFIFNLCEGIEGNVEDEALMPALFDILDVPYTGSDFFTLALCLDKAKTKQLLLAAQIPTPKYQVFYSPSDAFQTPISYPLIVKPLHEDASIGITMDSVVKDEKTLRERIAWIKNHYHQEALVEEYIDGREINATLLGNRENLEVLPLTELNFNFPPNLPHILDYEAKWIDTSFSFQNSTATCPAQLSSELAQRIRQMAMDAVRITGCRDYTRVDFRLRGEQPYVLEVNPNPSINPKSGFFRSAAASGLTYPQLIQKILSVAQQRYSHQQAKYQSQFIHSPPNSQYFSTHFVFSKITMKDIKYLHMWFNSPMICEYTTQPERIYTKEELIQKFVLTDTDLISWIITDRSTNTKIGFCTFFYLAHWNQSAKFSLFIGDKAMNTFEITKEIIENLKIQAMNQFGVHRLSVRILDANITMLLALDSTGFTRVGVLHSFCHGDEGRFNVVLYEYVRSI